MLINGLADTARGAVAYAVAIWCYEYILPQDILDDIVSRTLDTSYLVESRRRQGAMQNSGTTRSILQSYLHVDFGSAICTNLSGSKLVALLQFHSIAREMKMMGGSNQGRQQ